MARTSLGALTDRISGRPLAVAVAVLLLTATFFLVRTPEETRTVSAHFPRAVSIFVGSDVRVLGVNVGRVTAVVPEGNSVRVDMEYDAEHQLPADAQAAIITPTLVADRFVQLTPAYSGGEVMADGADIPLPDTGVPVELDRIYRSLRDLSQALGPNGVNADGTLDNLLRAGAESLDGQGKRGNRMLRDLAAAAQTFGEGSGDLFATVTELAEFTTTLAENDALVRAFIRDLAGVSAQLADERQELRAALRSVSGAVGTVESFVKDNRKALVTDVERLTRTVKAVAAEKESLDDALRIGPVAIGNLAIAFDNESGSIGSRIGISGNVWDADGFLCSIVQQSSMPKASKDLACEIFAQLLEPAADEFPQFPPAQDGGAEPSSAGATLADRDPAAVPVQQQYAADGAGDLDSLLGGG